MNATAPKRHDPRELRPETVRALTEMIKVAAKHHGMDPTNVEVVISRPNPIEDGEYSWCGPFDDDEPAATELDKAEEFFYAQYTF